MMIVGMNYVITTPFCGERCFLTMERGVSENLSHAARFETAEEARKFLSLNRVLLAPSQYTVEYLPECEEESQ